MEQGIKDMFKILALSENGDFDYVFRKGYSKIRSFGPIALPTGLLLHFLYEALRPHLRYSIQLLKTR